MPEDPDDPPRDFEFSVFRIEPELQRAFAAAFAERTRAGGRVRRGSTARRGWRTIRQFIEYLSELERPPATPRDLSPAHFRGWWLPRGKNVGVGIEISELKSTLRKMHGLTPEFVEELNRPGPPRKKVLKESYTRAENRHILRVARQDVRQAAQRIRSNRELISRWRQGQLDGQLEPHLRGRLLDYVDIHADVPRMARRPQPPEIWVAKLGSVVDHITSLHLSANEAAAFAVLLVGLTGQNPSTIAKAPAVHHRPDGYSTGLRTASIALDKPRRGSRRHMDVALTDFPVWAKDRSDSIAETESEKLDLLSAFGVYTLLVELAGPARKAVGTDQLLVWWSPTGGKSTGRGFRTRFHSDRVRDWSEAKKIPADTGGLHLEVTLERMRLTFNELQQRPVAHTDNTLANEYLARNRGNLLEYQKVVAAALAEQVDKADTLARLHTLSTEDVLSAQHDPGAVASRHGMDIGTLKRLLAGDLDTVLGGCIDHTHGPYSAAGQPCEASFIMCLSCPCARATPQHLPVQVLVHDEILARRANMTPMAWTNRYGLAHAQLIDLLNRAGEAAVEDARSNATQLQRELVQRFVNRDLDVA
ncbi:hypothetical protein [Mycobacteroides abscessus]